jgi:hypothetical protein
VLERGDLIVIDLDYRKEHEGAAFLGEQCGFGRAASESTIGSKVETKPFHTSPYGMKICCGTWVLVCLRGSANITGLIILGGGYSQAFSGVSMIACWRFGAQIVLCVTLWVLPDTTVEVSAKGAEEINNDNSNGLWVKVMVCI